MCLLLLACQFVPFVLSCTEQLLDRLAVLHSTDGVLLWSLLVLQDAGDWAEELLPNCVERFSVILLAFHSSNNY